MTDAEGMLDEEKLKRFVATRLAVHYLAGPPAMVEAMKAILARNGVAPGDVRSEEFFGY
jgi:ferredoxin-NADP reductase